MAVEQLEPVDADLQRLARGREHGGVGEGLGGLEGGGVEAEDGAFGGIGDEEEVIA